MSAALAARQDEIWDMLKDDHGQVKDTLGKMKDTMDPDLLNQVQQMLAVHMQFEETNLYPVLEKNPATKAIAVQARNEHQMAKQVLNNLVKSQGDRTQWAANVNQLDQLISTHVKNEESYVFREAKKLVNDDQARQLGAQYAEMKTQYKAKVQPQGGSMQQQSR
jgi:hemerythrin-like domain-containing protein